jgi:asparagine synthase (glutamine-hydrolysing)
MRLKYVPEPITMIEGVCKLPPGSFAVSKAGTFTITPFANVPLMPLVTGSKKDIAREVEQLVDKAVASELVSDRPVGLFLSGGLDSSIVLDAATKAAGTIETFSLRFDVTEEEQSEKFNTDADLAKQTAEYYGTTHHELLFTEAEFVRMLPEAAYYLDQPIANATAVAQMFLARESRKHIVVALAGDGGDELFGGYPRYRLSRLMDLYRLIPQPLRAICNKLSSRLTKLDTPPGIERIQRFLFEKDAPLSRVVSTQYMPLIMSDSAARTFDEQYLKGRGEHDFTQLFMDADRRSWLVDEALARTDTMSMAASLEERVPLLQFGIVEYASRIGSRMRVGLGSNKKILRTAFAGRLPAHVLAAKKRGFFSPTAKWLRRPAMLALAREVLSEGYHPGTDALLNFEGVQKMLEDHVAGRGYAMNLIWTLITLRLWARAFNATL